MDDKTRERLNKMLALALSAGDGEALAALAGVKRILEAQGKHASDVRVDVGGKSTSPGGFSDAHLLELLRLRTEVASLKADKQKLMGEVMQLRRQAAEAARPKGDSRPRLYKYPKPGTIRWLAERLLRQDDPVLTYYDVLVTVQANFPEAKTSVQSLRWYETQMRQYGYDVPSGRK